MPSTDRPHTDKPMFDANERRQLLQLARQSIELPLHEGVELKLDLQQWPQKLVAHGASFVTLKLAGNLRGCIGSIESNRPLVLDVSKNAHAAAFRDPRFEPVSAPEAEKLSLSLSILSQPTTVEFETHAQLLALLRPAIDGVILEARGRRAVFLPQVWELLPDPAEFICQLKQKANIPANIEAAELQASLFRVEAF